MVNVELYNIVVLCCGYFFYDASFTTTAVCLKYFIDSIKEENPNFEVDAYGGQGALFAVMAVCTLFSAIVVNKVGPRPAIVTAGCCQLFFNLQFLYPQTYLFYAGTVFRGIGSSLYDTAKGRFISQNSTNETIARNFAMFGWVQALNRIMGNLYFFIRLDTKVIDHRQKTEFFVSCTIATVFSIFFYSLLRKAKHNTPVKIPLKESCRQTWTIYALRDIWLLFPVTAYIAMHFTFSISMYGTGVGYTAQMGDLPAMRKINLCGTVFGFGMFLAGVVISVFGKKMTKRYFFPIILVGYLNNLITMILVFLNLPKNCIHEKTWGDAIITSNFILAVICAFFLGIGDVSMYSCQQSIVGFYFKHRIAYAYATSKLFGAGATSVFNSLTIYMNLYSVLGVLMVLGAIGVSAYVYSELKPSAQRLKEAQARAVEENAQDTLPAKSGTN